MHPGCAVGAAGIGVNLHDRLGQRCILDGSRRRRTLDRLIEGRGRDLEHPAGHRDREPGLSKLLDQPDHGFGRMFSRAK